MKHFFSIRNNIFKAAVVMVTLCTLFVLVYANDGGRVGRTSTSSAGCGSCHGSSATTATTLSCTSGSGSFTVAPGSTTTFNVTVSNPSSSLLGAGIDIAVKTDANGNPGTNAGTLSVPSGSPLYVSSGEVTHSTAQSWTGNNTITFSVQWTAPTTTGTYYLRAIGIAVNMDGNEDANDKWNWMTPQAITVQSGSTASITISSPNGGESWCAGSSHNITWSSTGVTNVKIDLSSDGGSSFPTTLMSSTSASSGSWPWSISSSQAAGTSYRVRVSDASNSATFSSSASNFSISTAPTITSQPSSQTVNAGSNVTFSVTASGSGLSYQWQKNSSNISGATSSSLTLNSVTSTSAGNYSCNVTNSCGTTSSETAVLTVNTQSSSLSISSPNGGESWCAGSSHNITWSSSGITNVRIDLSSNGGSTYPTTLIASTSASSGSWPWSIPSNQSAGTSYRVRVSDASNSATSSASASNFSISAMPSITSQPSSQTVSAGANVTFTVSASGSGLSYQWQKNSSNISGATSSSLTLNSVTSTSAGSYACVVSSSCGSVTSNTATLTVNTSSGGPVLTLNFDSYDFGNVRINTSVTHTITGELRNTGSSNLRITRIRIGGTNASLFSVVNASLPMNIAAGSSRSLTLRFRPTSTGDKSATVSFTDNASNNPTLGLSGTGTRRSGDEGSDQADDEINPNESITPSGIENITLFPNPASDNVNISFNLNESSNVEIRVFDMMGNLLNTLNEGYLNSGVYGMNWDGRDSHGLLIPNGCYNVVISTGDNNISNPLVIFR